MPHRLRSIFAGAATSLVLFTSGTARADYTATPNPATTWGTWEGWGASLCWWANVYGQRDDLADVVFTLNSTYLPEANATLPGLGFNIVRYNAGACSWNTAPDGSTMVASANIPRFKQISGFWLDWRSSSPTSTSWDWSVDANQRAMLGKAKARGANLFELFSNSPMWWMCSNHNPSGSADGTSDNLQTWNQQNHAIYMATVAKWAKDNWGITFTSVDPFNEPVATWWKSNGTQEGCHISPAAQASVISYLRTELNNRGLSSTIVSASDESYYDQATSTWNSFNSTTRSQVGRINTHGYQYSGGRRDLLFTAAAGKKLWNSEYGESDGTGMSLASNLNLDFSWLHMTAWCYWQPFDSGGWGLIQCNPGDNWMGPANPKYYVMAQYSRHIRSGMKIMSSGDANTVVAYDATAKKLVIVTANYGTAQWINFDLSKFTTVSGPISRWITVTGSGSKYEKFTDTSLSGKLFWSWFPANTVQTFEIQNVTP